MIKKRTREQLATFLPGLIFCRILKNIKRVNQVLTLQIYENVFIGANIPRFF